MTAIPLPPFLKGPSLKPQTLFGSPAISLLEKRSIGFASPPRDGFAFLAERFPEERCACITNHYGHKHKHMSRVGGKSARSAPVPISKL